MVNEKMMNQVPFVQYIILRISYGRGVSEGYQLWWLSV